MCLCGLSRDYEECCGAIISHKRSATSAEELMRSRYSAYVKGDGVYLLFSTACEEQVNEDVKLIEEFCANVTWLKLDVLKSTLSEVEFKAYYRDAQGIKLLHEKSRFVQEDGVWKYKNGNLFNTKIERNESCPCGSGKKYKKCCGS